MSPEESEESEESEMVSMESLPIDYFDEEEEETDETEEKVEEPEEEDDPENIEDILSPTETIQLTEWFNQNQPAMVREWDELEDDEEKSHLFLLAVVNTNLSNGTLVNPADKTRIDFGSPEFNDLLILFDEKSSRADNIKMGQYLRLAETKPPHRLTPFNPSTSLTRRELIEQIISQRQQRDRDRERRQQGGVAIPSGIGEPVEREGIKVRTDEGNQLFSTT